MSRPVSVIRKDSFKIHQYFAHGAIELYDLSQDPSASINLRWHIPQKIADNLAELKAWQSKTTARIPSRKNKSYDRAYEFRFRNRYSVQDRDQLDWSVYAHSGSVQQLLEK